MLLCTCTLRQHTVSSCGVRNTWAPDALLVPVHIDLSISIIIIYLIYHIDIFLFPVDSCMIYLHAPIFCVESRLCNVKYKLTRAGWQVLVERCKVKDTRYNGDFAISYDKTSGFRLFPDMRVIRMCVSAQSNAYKWRRYRRLVQYMVSPSPLAEAQLTSVSD